ncbi:MAG: hexapeptide transferase [Flavobacteriaceae bacterium]|nr:MAG: hexapeptide transferase [Flavobacteriaceae bacterium]
MKRILYLGYYIKKMDWKKFNLFLNYTAQKTDRNKISILLDVLSSVFKYNISILEYFQFRFFEKTADEKEKWAGTGYMYEYQQKMNPINGRSILDDKTEFYRNYKKFFVHKMADINNVLTDKKLVELLLNNPSGKIVFKAADGNCGAQVKIMPTSEFDASSLVTFMRKYNYDLVEEFVVQHPRLNELSPSAVNTVRVFSQLNVNNEVELLGCRLRISIDSPVDNMAAGNMAAPIDDTTGIVSGPGVFSDITKTDKTKHPITGVEIVGIEIPFWKEVISMVNEAHLSHPQNRSIGWDIVITENGPGFIEGNHDWCKLLWQLPVKSGMKSVLQKYYSEYV